MGSSLDIVDDETLPGIMGASEGGVLMLSKTTCGNCATYTTVIKDLLKQREPLRKLTWGKVFLDKPGSRQYKIDNRWLPEVGDLPHTVLYKDGQIIDRFSTSSKYLLLDKLREHELIPA